MQLKALAPWFGSKRGLAPTIVEQLGPHKYYIEPFCGSLAVLLAKDPTSHELACDLHGDLVNLGRVCQEQKSAVQGQIVDRCAMATSGTDRVSRRQRGQLRPDGDQQREQKDRGQQREAPAANGAWSSTSHGAP